MKYSTEIRVIDFIPYTSSNRHSEWNKRMLLNIFHLVDNKLVVYNNNDGMVAVATSNHSDDRDGKKVWKKLLVTTIDVMSKVDIEVSCYLWCIELNF